MNCPLEKHYLKVGVKLKFSEINLEVICPWPRFSRAGNRSWSFL